MLGSTMPTTLESLKARLADIDALHNAVGVMDWDQQCYMPQGGGEARAEHVSRLSRMSHDLTVSDETLRLADEARPESDEDAALLRIVRRDLEKATKIPSSLVEEKSRLSSLAHEQWVRARKADDFASFAPTLERLFEIAREEARHLGYTDHPYDALTDLYEEGATKNGWDAMFDTIRQPLVELVARIKESGVEPDRSFLHGDWDKGAQMEFTTMLAKAVGFDFDRGRQDTAPHPFCTNFSVGDVRLTTRFLDELTSAIFGTLHEAGHGMYEQGSPMEWDRTPLSGGVSLGVHESQSRTWENIVGRSRAFWQRYLPDLKRAFPALPDVDLDTFIKAVNRVEPSLIRVEADEVTYNLHIMVRYEAECDLLTEAVRVRDLPEYWNEKYRQYLGIVPPDNRDGCLQDVHWSGGMVGYFPTYSMGNILSYQFWGRLTADLGDPFDLIAHGDFAPILGWLREHIYRHGSYFTPEELIKRVTGEGLNAKPYLDGITAKYEGLYGLRQTVAS